MAVYTCGHCGETTGEKGHLCDPVELTETVVCDCCGVATTDPRHICRPKLEKINFVCVACGRVARYPNELCNPRDIELMSKQEPPEKIV